MCGVTAKKGSTIETPTSLPLGAQIVAAWLGESGFQTADGAPGPLPRLPRADDAGINFEALVDRVARQDLRARSVLDEWLRLGLVSLDEQQQVHLKVEAFIPGRVLRKNCFISAKPADPYIAVGADNP